MVAGKPDLTFGRFRFRCNFQTMRNLQKGTMKMSSRGPKLVEMTFWVAENGRKITNFLVVHGGSRRRFVGLIQARPAAVRCEIPPVGSSRCCAPPRPARVACGRPVVSRLVRSLTARNLTKGPIRFPIWRAPS